MEEAGAGRVAENVQRDSSVQGCKEEENLAISDSMGGCRVFDCRPSQELGKEVSTGRRVRDAWASDCGSGEAAECVCLTCCS